MSRFLPRDVVIVGAARTVIGSFCGSMSGLTATELGAVAIQNAVRRARIDPTDVEQVYMGHVLQGGCGQSPARQALLAAGLPESCEATTVNKVCASGLKSIMQAAQDIALGHSNVVVAGGMESMSNAPYMLKKARSKGYMYGHGQLEDMVLGDGLWDVYNKIHMGNCGEKLAKDFGIGRLEQDQYCLESYKRASLAWKSGVMGNEVVSVTVPGKKPIEISQDEEFTKVKLEKVASLNPAFEKNGTITAANASSLNDGAAAVVLMSLERAQAMGVTPLARILSFADNAVAPIDFGMAPAGAVSKALKFAGLKTADFHEINEAFSVVPLVNMRLLDLDYTRVNVHGGAVALGHPIGASGCRIVNSLLNVLTSHDASTGTASICNGGGGSSAIVIERM